MFTARPVFAAGDQQIGLARQERRNLQDIDDCARRSGLVGVVHVGQERKTGVAL